MDTRGRPRVIVNGVRRTRTFHYFWCQTCQRAVRIPSSVNPNSSFCPFCSHQLRHELDVTTPRLLMNLPSNLHPSPATQLMNSLALILNPPMTRRNRTAQWIEEDEEDEDGSNSWISFRFVRATRPQRQIPRSTGNEAINGGDATMTFQNNRLEPPATTVRPTRPFRQTGNEVVNAADATTIFQTNRQGPQPAADFAIEGLPTVRLTATQLRIDPNCAICKDDFGVDMEVKELPCKHFYHCDCIVPWLRIQNTCPICRYQLQVASVNHFHYENYPHFGDFEFGFEEATQSLNWLWSQFASFRPFRALVDWTHRYFDFQENHHRGGRGGISWWRSLFII